MKIFKTRDNVIRSGWSLLILFVAVYGWQILAGFVIGIVWVISYMMKNGMPDQNMINSLTASATALTSNVEFMYISYAVMIALILGLWKLLYRQPFKRMGLSMFRWLPHLGYGLLFGAASMSIVFICLYLTGNTGMVSINIGALLDILFWAGLLKYVFVGFFEEILSRGYMMSALKTTRNKWVIFFLPAVVFGLLHLMNPSVGVLPVVNIALVGVLFGYMVVKTGDIWMPIGFHITWNFFQGNIFGFQVSGNAYDVSVLSTPSAGSSLINGGGFGPEGGLVVTLIALLGIVWVHFFVKGRPHPDFWKMIDEKPGLPVGA